MEEARGEDQEALARPVTGGNSGGGGRTESGWERALDGSLGGNPPRGSAVRPPAQSERTAIGGKASWDSLTMLSLSGCWVKIFFRASSTNRPKVLPPAAQVSDNINIFLMLADKSQ